MFCAYGITPFRMRTGPEEKDITTLELATSKMRSKGESKKMIVNNKVFLWHTMPSQDRNSIEPFHFQGIFAMANGAVLNPDYCKKLTQNYVYRSKNDHEIFLAMYITFGSQFTKYVGGVFSFLIYDSKKDLLLAGRDDSGMANLYIQRSENKICISSELRSIKDCEQFPKGHIFIKSKHDLGAFFKYFIEDNRKLDQTAIVNKITEIINSFLKENECTFLIANAQDEELLSIVKQHMTIDDMRVIKLESLPTFDISDIEQVISSAETCEPALVRKNLIMRLLSKGIRGTVITCEDPDNCKSIEATVRNPLRDYRLSPFSVKLSSFEEQSVYEEELESSIKKIVSSDSSTELSLVEKEELLYSGIFARWII